MEADATASPNPPPAPAPEEASQEDSSPVSPSFSSSAPAPVAAAAPPEARKVAAAMEAVERDAAAIAESYASLFASLRIALSNVTSTSSENMECLGEVVGRLQESALEASSKGNKYIHSCLRLNEEMRGLESLSIQLWCACTYGGKLSAVGTPVEIYSPSSSHIIGRQPTTASLKWCVQAKKKVSASATC